MKYLKTAAPFAAALLSLAPVSALAAPWNTASVRQGAVPHAGGQPDPQDPVQAWPAADLVPAHLSAQMNAIPHHELASLELPALPGSHFEVRVPFEGEEFALELHLHSVRSADFQCFERGSDGTLVPVMNDHVRTFRGFVRGRASSRVAGSLLPTGAEMLIDLGDGRSLEVQPHFDSFLAGSRDTFLVFDNSTVLEAPADCGTTDAPVDVGAGSGGGPDDSGAGCAGGYCSADLALELDHSHYAAYGESLAASVAIAEQSVNVANLQYEEQLDIRHEITTMIVNTSLANEPPGYAAAPTRLDLLIAFRDYWRANYAWIERDVAHLMTARYSGGVAYVGTLCSQVNGFGLDFSDTATLQCRANLLAHELGHNWNAGHCACDNPGGLSFTMNPEYPPCALYFNPSLTVPGMEAFRDSRSCLEAQNEIDNVLDAQVIGPGVYLGSTVTATLDGTSSCDGSPTPGPDVWYRYTPASSGTASIQTCQAPTNFDTTLSVWRGCPRNASATEIACNNNACGAQSVVSASVTAGTTYWIRLAGYNGARGVYSIILNGPPAAVPVNDDVSDAVIIGPGEYRGTLLSATSDGSAPCDGSGATRDLWYRYHPATSGNLRIDACYANFSVALSLHDANHPNPSSSAATLACAAQNCGSGASLVTTVASSEEYLIRVAGVGTQAGSFLLRVSGREADASLTAMAIEPGQRLVMDMNGAGTPSGGTTCGDDTSDNLPAYKYTFTAAQSGTLRMRTCGTHDFGGIDLGVEPVLSLHAPQGSTIPLPSNQIGCSVSNSGECLGDLGANFDAYLEAEVFAGVEYLVRVGQARRVPGASLVLLEVDLAPAFDSCGDAEPISVGSWQGTISDTITSDGTSTCAVTSASPDVWYRFDAPASGVLTIDTCGTRDLPGADLGLDTMLSLHSGCPGNVGNQLACSFGAAFGLCANPLDALVSKSVAAGQSVYIRVASEQPNVAGDFLLEVDFQPALQGADCSNAIPGAPGVYQLDLAGAGASPGYEYPTSEDLWFRYVAPAEGIMTIRTCGTHDMGGVDQGVPTFVAAYSDCGSSMSARFYDQRLDSVCALSDAGVRRDERMPVPVQPGEVVYLRVGHEPGSSPGPVRVTISFTEFPYTVCDGTGWRRDCPCGNQSDTRGEGCVTSLGVGSLITAEGTASLSADDLDLSVSSIRPGALMLFISGDSLSFNPAYDGLVCLGGDVIRAMPVQADSTGVASLESVLGAGGLSRGASEIGQYRYLQGWFRDIGGPCGTGGNFSAALLLRILP